jgi:hypothetical protein
MPGACARHGLFFAGVAAAPIVRFPRRVCYSDDDKPSVFDPVNETIGKTVKFVAAVSLANRFRRFREFEEILKRLANLIPEIETETQGYRLIIASGLFKF